jgi:hypothetical protein
MTNGADHHGGKAESSKSASKPEGKNVAPVKTEAGKSSKEAHRSK